MLSGDTVAVAMVFGNEDIGTGPESSLPECKFNRTDYGSVSGVNTINPCVLSDWPVGSTLVQYLGIVPGSPSEVPTRANNIVGNVPPPQLIVPPSEVAFTASSAPQI